MVPLPVPVGMIYNVMNSTDISANALKNNFSRAALKEAAAFLRKVEQNRQSYEPMPIELCPVEKEIEQRIRHAFAGVTCYREVRVLLGGEAEDDYMSPEAQALLAPLEERDDWQNIPDDLLSACSCALSYAGPHAYRFLVPRFLIGSLHGIVICYPGLAPHSDLELYTRSQMGYLNEAQQACLSDYLDWDACELDEESRRQFLPWELDEYHVSFAKRMSYAEYGKILLQRFREKYAQLLS